MLNYLHLSQLTFIYLNRTKEKKKPKYLQRFYPNKASYLQRLLRTYKKKTLSALFYSNPYEYNLYSFKKNGTQQKIILSHLLITQVKERDNKKKEGGSERETCTNILQVIKLVQHKQIQ